MIEKIVQVILISSILIPNLVQGQNSDTFIGKKASLELGIGYQPMRYWTSLVKQVPHYKAPLNAIIKGNFSYAINRTREIDVEVQISSNIVYYEAYEWSSDGSQEEVGFFIDDDIGYSESDLSNFSEGFNLGSFRKINNKSLFINYRLYHGGSIIPIGRYVKFGLGITAVSLDTPEVNIYTRPERQDVLKTTTPETAIIPSFQLGYYYKKFLSNSFFLSFGANLKVPLELGSRRVTIPNPRQLLNNQSRLDEYFAQHASFQLSTFEYLTLDLKLGFLF